MTRGAPTTSRILPFWIVFLILWCSSIAVVAQQVPAELLAKALNHAKHMQDPESTIQQLQTGNIDTLYKVAKSLNENGDRITSVLIWHTLADGEANHILSQVALGFTYSEEDKPQAIKYFVQAGEDGPHQAALYNAGRLFFEVDDLVRALAYLRTAATLTDTEPMYARPKMTATSREAYDTLSRQIQNIELSMEQAANLFPYSHISNFPQPGSGEEKLFEKAMGAIQVYAQTKDVQHVKTARQHLAKLQDHPELSDLQKYLLQTLVKQTLKQSKDEL